MSTQEQRAARRLDTAPVLIDTATDLLARISRLAIHARPPERLRLMGELALVERVVKAVERGVVQAAQRTLKTVKPPRALPASRRALPKGRTP